MKSNNILRNTENKTEEIIEEAPNGDDIAEDYENDDFENPEEEIMSFDGQKGGEGVVEEKLGYYDEEGNEVPIGNEDYEYDFEDEDVEDKPEMRQM
mmetsp:Transcript_3003/g.2591  ORF Transcript_3003/g.2591 Transcript_3003/m.2591 type:complete len:96 (+) Transcript_3003:66-353(+)